VGGLAAACFWVSWLILAIFAHWRQRAICPRHPAHWAPRQGPDPPDK